jgi:hypothetical protein
MNMINKNTKCLPLLLAVACGGQQAGYYDDGAGKAPSISGFTEGGESERGNVGGQEVILNGSGFGDDDTAVVVYFGSLNADILEVSDEQIRLRTPRGPIKGGAVDIAVATPHGVADASGGYLYDMGKLYHENEVGYLVATNYWMSCYGGADDLDVGCDTITYTGFSGIEGKSEFFEFAFPRIHTPNVGFYAGIDVSPDEWTIESPGQVNFPYLSFVIDDLRFNVNDDLTEDGSNFMLKNSVWADEEWCSDLSTQTSWDFPGAPGVPASSVTATGSILDEGNKCCDPVLEDCAPEDNLSLALDTLSFCETLDYGEAHTFEYEAAWPAGENFFAGDKTNKGPRKAAKVDLTVTDAGIEDLRLKLPKPMIVEAPQGFSVLGDIPSLWTVGGGFSDCFDNDGDGNTGLDETAFTFEWEPADLDNLSPAEEGSAIVSANTYVRVSLTYLAMGWLGGEGYPVRATITVPDKNNYDKDTGKSSVSMPVETLYQLPAADGNWGGEGSTTQGPSGRFSYGDSSQRGYGYVVVTVDRVTEYGIAAPGFTGDVQLDDASKPPVVVFAYVTGDFGFFSWENPLSGGICGNCLDDDGDGWSDADDPDCAGDEPTESTTKYCIGENGFAAACECSDGIDNDGDDLIDGQDSDCSGPDDEIEGGDPCVDGEDNDGDGWIDGDDTECDNGSGREEGLDAAEFSCSNGVDDDLDGWIDSADPGCGTGTDLEDDGLSGSVCNDGIDQDGHGDADALDPHCAANGADHDAEEPVYKSQCLNELDDDGDGYIDANDPGCEVEPYWDEAATPLEGFLTECTDEIDNDGDTFTDAADLGCENQDSGFLDGHLNDEAAVTTPN